MSAARIRRALAALLVASAGCVQALGDYTLSEAVPGAPCQEETQTTDCPTGYACYANSTCVKTCNDDPDCGAFHSCGAGFCSYDVGTDCEGSRHCGSGACIDRDASGNAVSRYCTFFCSASSGAGGGTTKLCPDGYDCVDYECRRYSLPR